MGFDVGKFVTSVADDKKCMLCHDVLDNPVRSSCGHVFCSGCIVPWLDQHGQCPKKCRILASNDLENVLPLREVILNLKVRCEFFDSGCLETFKLTDVAGHSKRCRFKPVECGNPGCGKVVTSKDLYTHETEGCSRRPVGKCGKGCGLVLYLHSMDIHDCYDALKTLMKSQEKLLCGLEERLRAMQIRFSEREGALLTQVTALSKQLERTVHVTRSGEEDKGEIHRLEVGGGVTLRQMTLHRDRCGSLGFNIKGGFKQESDTSNESVGVVISRVTEGGVGFINGVRVSDRIIKVNGQDLSNSSHHEAVEAFRSAREPIIVEVLRRSSKSTTTTSHSSSRGLSRSGSSSSRGMKSRYPAMVSIATQTEEDFYCCNRPPTPPPGFYPIPVATGLYQPSSRRPVAFSPSAEMGLTDIEMAHNMDLDDPYFDDRQYEIIYEDVLLRRTSSDEKLGLTLCYGSLEDELTDIFISEVDPCSIAGKDGRIREGDQIVQINGVDVRSRSEAISLFSGNGTDISLTVARAQLQLQFDDGFLEEPNLVLDDLHMELLEKHHQDNMQFMASMLAQHHIDEDGVYTDTTTTSQNHEKDSGVGRTDESLRNEESCEQETDSESVSCNMHQLRHISFLSSGLPGRFPGQPDTKCGNIANTGQEDADPKYSEGSLDLELAFLNNEIQTDCPDFVDSHLSEQQRLAMLGYKEFALRSDAQKSARIVPRMGTRLEYSKLAVEAGLLRKSGSVGSGSGSPVVNINNNNKKTASSQGYSNSSAVPSSSSSTMSSTRGVNSEFSSNTSATLSSVTSTRMCDKDKENWTTTSAYNTGESCRSTPLTLELNPASDEHYEHSALTGSLLCLATPTSGSSSGLVTSDTEKQTQTPTKPRDYSSEDSGHGQHKGSSSSHTIKAISIAESMKSGLLQQAQMGESLQDLYVRCAGVMYTNKANLQHTIAVQQKLFQQQLHQQARLRGHINSPGHSNSGSGNDAADAAKGIPGQTAPSDSGQMEWVVKRRPDGSRYITRRPVRSKLLKERAKKISEERCGLTTDDDAMSEMKTGRYWSKEDRKRHLEKAKDYKKKRELIVKAKMETLKEIEEKKEMNIVELSHRKMMRHKGRKVFDNFTTVKEMLAHGNKVGDGKPYNPLLSVTTV